MALTAPARVTYNDHEMIRRSSFMNGVTRVVDAKTVSTTNRFSCTNTQGKTYTNCISLEPLEFASPSSAALSKVTLTVLPVTCLNIEDDVKTTHLVKDNKNTDYSSEVRDGRGVVGFR